MAKKVITKKARVSVIKKRWYAVQAPKVFNNVVFGETLAAEPESLKGRGIKTNLGTVIRSVKKQSMEVRFKITEVQGNTCSTEFVNKILMGDIYKDLKVELKTIYPVSAVEMRAFVCE